MSDGQFQIAFAGGMDESADPRLVPPGTVIAALNQRYDLDGQYAQRWGYAALCAPSTLGMLAAYGNELLVVDKFGALNSLDSSATGTLQSKDTLNPFGVTHRAAWSATSSFNSWGECVIGAFRVLAWIDLSDNRPRIAVYDTQTDACVSGPTVPSAAAYSNINVMAVNGVAIIVASHTGGSGPIAWRITPAAGAVPSGSTLLGSGGVTPYSSVNAKGGVYAVAGMSTTFACVYEATTVIGGFNTVQLVVRTFNNACALQQETITTVATANVNTHIALAGAMCARGTTGENLWIGYEIDAQSGITGGTYIGRWDPATAVNSMVPVQMGAITAYNTMCIERLSATLCLFVSDTYSVPQGSMYWQQFNTSGAIGTMSQSFNTGIASSPIYIASLGTAVMFCLAGYDSTPGWGGSFFLVDLQTGTTSANVPALLAVVMPKLAVASTASPPSLLVDATGTSTVFECVLPILRSTGRTGLEVMRLDLNAAQRWCPAALGKEMYLGGQMYDTNRATEIGFAYDPPKIGALTASGVGVFTGTWSYCFTYAHCNAKGDIEESAPSPVKSVTAASNAKFTAVCTTQTMTRKQRLTDVAAAIGPANPIYIVLYRQQVAGSGDTVFYRVNNEPFPVGNQNTLTAASVSIDDRISDADLTDGTHPVLYTTSGELPHGTPDNPTHVIAHKNRLWGIGGDQRTIWYSQVYVDSSVPSWSATQTITVDDTNEPLIALASCYDKLVAFTKNRAYVIYGDGPAINGQGNDLTQPQRIPLAAGCIEPRSIVQTPLGIMYQSPRGIELITPGLAPDFLGLPVSVSTSTYPICTSAALCPNTNTVRFTFATSEARQNLGTGRIVLYDLNRNRWAVHSLTQQGVNVPAVDAPPQSAVYHPVFGYCVGENDASVAAVAFVQKETVNAFSDVGYWVTLSVTTGWHKAAAPQGQAPSPADAQGWQRVRRVRLLAQSPATPCGMTATLKYDYDTGTSDTRTLNAAFCNTVTSGFTKDTMQVRLTPLSGYARCEAIQLTLKSTGPDGSLGGTKFAPGFSFIGYALETLQKKGGYRKMPASAKV